MCYALLSLLCLTLCNRMDCSPPGSSGHGTFQARVLEWVVISSSRGSSQPRTRTQVSCISCIARGFSITESLRSLVEININDRSSCHFSRAYSCQPPCYDLYNRHRTWLLPWPSGTVAVVTFILQWRKLRHREVKCISQGATGSKWRKCQTQ